MSLAGSSSWRAPRRRVRYLQAFAVMKPAWGTAIKFLDSTTTQLLETDRLFFVPTQLQYALHHIYTRTKCLYVSVIDFYIGLFQILLLFVFQYKIHSNSIVLCNFSQIKTWSIWTHISNNFSRCSRPIWSLNVCAPINGCKYSWEWVII